MKEKDRILIIPSWYPPDGGYFFKEHSEAVQQKGWKVDVLVTRLVGIRKLVQAGPSALRPYRITRENGLRVIRSFYLKVPGCEKYNIHGWARKTLRNYKKYEKRFGKPALILVHSVTWAGYAAYLIHRKYHVPYIIVEHRSFFVWSSRWARRMVKPFYLHFFKRAYGRCRRLILVSESQRAGIEALVPSAIKRVQVIPNMIRADQFLPPSGPRSAEPFRFLWAGRLEHVKGIDLLLEAVKMLAARTDQPFTLRLAGKGSLRKKLEKQSESLGLTDRVSFLGRLSREELLKEMQQASCFVLPSRFEAFGMVLIEAMATGLPVIATASGGPEFIVTPENGLLVEQGSADELAGAMERMMATYSRYSPEAIRNATLHTFGDESVMSQYDQLFEHFLRE